MKSIETTLKGVFIIEPKVFNDERGFFYESYSAQKLATVGINTIFVQDNHSKSVKGVLRGLHYQKGAAAQTKLVRCVQGEIYDVAVDLRKNSPTFGQWFGCILSAENKKQLYIPKGFAHGFAVLSETAEFLYKCDSYYNPQSERGIIWNDPQLNISWDVSNPIISAKDNKLPLLAAISAEDLFN
jgi:dTDP-4-dehydrorhamnose 3,5-epimerase